MYKYVLCSVLCSLNLMFPECVPSTLTLLEVMTINLQKQHMLSGHIFSIYILLEKLNTILYLIYLKMTWKPQKCDDFTLKVSSVIGPSPPTCWQIWHFFHKTNGVHIVADTEQPDSHPSQYQRTSSPEYWSPTPVTHSLNHPAYYLSTHSTSLQCPVSFIHIGLILDAIAYAYTICYWYWFPYSPPVFSPKWVPGLHPSTSPYPPRPGSVALVWCITCKTNQII